MLDQRSFEGNSYFFESPQRAALEDSFETMDPHTAISLDDVSDDPQAEANKIDFQMVKLED